MRVLLITAHDHWGNSLDAISPIAKIVVGLGAAGHQVRYISSDKVNDPVNAIYGEPIRFFHEQVGIVRFRIPGDAWLWPYIRQIPIVRSFYHRLREMLFLWLACTIGVREALAFKPDVVYGYEVLGVLAAKRVATLLGLPFVTRFQGSILYPHLTSSQKGIVSWLRLLKYRHHVQALKCPADLIVMTNDGTRGEWVVRALGNHSPMVFWPNGTDFLEDSQCEDDQGSACHDTHEELGIPVDAQVILSVSRLVDWKRVDRIMKAMPLVIARVPDAWYVVVGDGSERPRLQEMARELGVSARVVFTGNLPHSKVRQVMKHAAVFVSMYDLSNVGNPLIEALSLGKPIVTYDVGDTRDVIQDGENGLLLESDAPETVADAIVRILTDKGLAQRLTAGAKRYADAHFWTWKQRINAEIALLEKVVKGDHVTV